MGAGGAGEAEGSAQGEDGGAPQGQGAPERAERAVARPPHEGREHEGAGE